MRFPEFNPPNLPPATKEAMDQLPTEATIAKAREEYEAAQRTLSKTGAVIDKINMVEAETRLRLLEQDHASLQQKTIEGIEVREGLSVTEEIAELKKKIESAKRGTELARSLGDNDRTTHMEQKQEEFKGTLAALQQLENASSEQTGAANESAFDQATQRENLNKQKVA